MQKERLGIQKKQPFMEKSKFVYIIACLSLIIGFFTLSTLLFTPKIPSVSAYDANGLNYTYDSDTNSYTVSGSDKTFTTITIPSTYDDGTNGSKPVVMIGTQAFYENSKLTSITIPTSMLYINNYAFYGCSSLTSITIPNGVIGSIDYAAFKGCSSLTTITIPSGITSIGVKAFEYCSSLTEIVIPSSVTSIGENAFLGCSSLTSITIPNGVTSIGKSAFSDSGLTSITIPSSVNSIGYAAFSGCSSLTSIEVSSNNANYSSLNGVLFNKDQTVLIRYPEGKIATFYTIPTGVTSLGGSAFAGCSNLISIIFEEGSQLTSIGQSTFGACSGLTEITIPSSVTSIGNSAFYNCLDLIKVSFEAESQLKYINYGAFGNCSSLTSITIPSSVTNIDHYSFNGCTNLTTMLMQSPTPPTLASTTAISTATTKIYVPNASVATYQVATNWSNFSSKITSEFEYYGFIFTLNTDNISYSVTGIDNTRTSVEIPATYNGLPVTVIATEAFKNYSNLTSITIPSGVTEIGTNAFLDCSDLSSIEVDINNGYYISNNGVLFNKDQTTILCHPIAKTASSYTIPSGVINIGESAFRGCLNLDSITIPSGVTNIGSYAFENCTSLTSIAIPNGVTTIGTYTFYNCLNLTSITITSGVTNIGSHAFENCTSLTQITLPNELLSIGDQAFRNCSILPSITIPSSVTNIGNIAFYNCSSLNSVSVSLNNANYSSLNGVLLNKDQTALIHYPRGKTETSYTILNTVTSIKNSAFSGCSVLTEIIIPNSVSSIGNGAFQNCSSLDSITIPKNITAIDHFTFSNCSSLTSVTIPDSVTSIGIGAFDGCSSLTSITIPNSVTSIGLSAFANCSSLTTMLIQSSTPPTLGATNAISSATTKIYVPHSSVATYKAATNWKHSSIINKITSDSEYYALFLTFELINEGTSYSVKGNDSTRTSIEIPATYLGLPVTTIVDEAFFNYSNLESVIIPNSVTTIGQWAFRNCSNLGSVIIPNSVTSIGIEAFMSCSSLTSIVIPNSVTSIAMRAFGDCSSLQSVIFEEGSQLTTIGVAVFRNCSDLESVIIPNDVTSIENYAFYGCTNLTTITIPSNVLTIGNSAFYGCSSLAEITIPSGVATIGYSAFQGCTGLQSITIPNTVATIGYSIFQDCSNLQSVIFEDGSQLTTIINNAFYGCTNLTSIIIPNGIKVIGTEAFYNCSSLPSITIPNSVTSIGLGAFRDCTSLTSITIPSSVTSIGNGAFYDCTSLTSIEIPNSVTSIGEDAFYNCSSLTEITIPNSVTSIGTTAFHNCSSLIEIAIPKSVTSIGYGAFMSCSKLKTMIMRSTTPPALANLDAISSATTKIYVPRGSVSAYKSAANWENYADKIFSETVEVVFKNWDGSVLDTQEFANGGTATAPTDPTRPATAQYTYTFDGWDIEFDNVTEDLVVTATYSSTVNQYTVTFEDWNGTVLKTDTVDYGTGVTAPTDPAKTGYTFNSWLGDYSYVVENITVTATYTINQYTISFNSNNGSAVADITQDFGTSVLAPTAPSKSGYLFSGWFTDNETFANEYVFPSTMSASNITLYAKWTADEYTVSFDYQGATGGNSQENKEVTFNAGYGELPEPTKTGFIFAGWFTEISGGTQITAGTVVSVSSSHTLYAHWTTQIYEVKFVDWIGGEIETQNVAYMDSAVAPNDPTREGYRFINWDKPFNYITSDLTVTAIYAPVEYTIEYTLNGGTVEGTNPVTYNIETETFTLINPTRLGYDFIGWTGTGLADLTMTVTVSENSIGNREYTANWSAVTYDISYDLDSGMVEGNNPTTYTIEDEITLINPTREGYNFLGWTGTGLSVITKNVTISKGNIDTRFYTANWSATEYTIEYTLNDGTVEGTNPATYNIETETFTLINPTRVGYDFIGWTGTELEDLTMTVTVSENSIGNREYTANWSAVTYDISYDLDSGTVEGTNPTTYNIETETFILINPTREGYNFLGWTGTDIDGYSSEVTVLTGNIGNRAYTANWEIQTFTVTFYDEDGTTVLKELTVDYGTTILAPNDPIKETTPQYTFTFNGWNKEIPETITENITFTATYSSTTNQYTVTFEDWNGTVLKTDTVDYGTDATAPTDPAKTGYTFNSWLGDYSYVVENITVTATYSPITYYVQFNANDGTGIMENQEFTYDLLGNLTANTFTRVGYTFAGWLWNSETYADEDSILNLTTNSETLTFVAQWTPNQYTVSFDYQGATGGNSQENKEVTFNAGYGELPEPTKTGFIFAGWFTEISGGTRIMAGTVVSVSSSHTLYAHWTTQIYEVKFVDWNGGEIETQNVAYMDSAVAPNDPTREGYRFINWDKPFNYITSDLTVTAIYAPVEYTIEYTLNGGTVEGTNPVTYNIETETFTLINPTRVGYDFIGWTGTELEDLTMTVTVSKNSIGNREYTANWSATEYTIEYTLNGGTVEGNNPATYNIETETFTLINPTREGYNFLGWTGTGLSVITKNVTISKGNIDTRFYTANWSATEYTIEYTLNDGTVEGTNPATYNIETETFTLINPTRVGYDFIGWTGTELEDLTMTVTVSENSIGNREYTANWSAVTYDISYDLDNGTVEETNPTTYNIETETFILINPTREGYIFLGWTGTDIDGYSSEVTVLTGSIGNRTYTANWQIKTFNVTFYGKDGELLKEQTVNYGSSATAPELPEYMGFEIEGWDIAFTDVKTDLVITINYVIKNYSIIYALNDGTIKATNPVIYNIETESFTLINPTKEGHIFLGWTGTDIDGYSSEVTVLTGSIGNRTYTANWQIKTFNVTFYGKDGELLKEQTVNYGSSATAPELPEYMGFEIEGWDIAFTDVKRDLVITINYVIKNYSIIYALNDGTIKATNPVIYNIETESFTLINPTKEGHIFLGWTGTDIDEYSSEVTVLTGSIGNRTYTANWEKITYTVTFIDYDGEELGRTTVEYGNKIANPANPTWDNRKFIGWFADAEWTIVFNFETIYNTDVVIYAKSEAEISLTFVEKEGETTKSTSLTVNKEYEELSAFMAEIKNDKAGYTLTGWEYKNLTTNETVIVDADTIFDYAAGVAIQGIYVAKIYTISFDLYYPNSTNPIKSIEISFGDSITFLPTPVRDGYTFMGWFLGDEKVEVGDIYKISDNATLRAVWEVKPFNFTLIAIVGGAVLLILAGIVIYVIRRKKKLKNLSIGKTLYKH